MASADFYRSPYARFVFAWVKFIFAAVGVLFLVGSAMGFSDALMSTHFGYRLSDGVLGMFAAALCGLGWVFVNVIRRRLLAGSRG
jgi:hypothetical protein